MDYLITNFTESLYRIYKGKTAGVHKGFSMIYIEYYDAFLAGLHPFYN
jgi:hypothetical protein